MAGTADECGSTQIFKYRGILTLTDTTLMFAFLQRFLQESRGFAFFLMFQVTHSRMNSGASTGGCIVVYWTRVLRKETMLEIIDFTRSWKTYVYP